MPVSDMPSQDEVTRMWRDLVCSPTEQPVSVSDCFAMQVFMTIQVKLGDRTCLAFEKLQAKADDEHKNITRTLDVGEHGATPPQATTARDGLMALRTTIQTWIFGDPIRKAARNCGTPCDEHALLESHPLLAGTMMYKLSVDSSVASITYVNALGGVIRAAHA